MDRITFYSLIFFVTTIAGCNKSEFLDTKPNTNLVVPKSVGDLTALMENYIINNNLGNLTEVASGDFYLLTDAALNGQPEYLRNTYIWNQEVYNGQENISDWNAPFASILYCNIALDGLKEIQNDSSQAYRSVYGWALFTRAHAFFSLAQTFCKPYDDATASSDPGIPLRLTSAIEQVSKRASIKQTYDQIVADVKRAADLLPDQVRDNPNKPNKAAAYGFLSRVYLSMRQYGDALLYSSISLSSYSKLLNYNTLTTTANINPFGRKTDEVLYQVELGTGTSILSTNAANTKVDSLLYRSYEDKDLRKSLYFRVSTGGPQRKGGYTGTILPFGGVATDEIYLINAECLVRSGEINAGLKMVDSLLKNRYQTGSYIPKAALSKEDALEIVLTERRKELVFRGLRWIDLRRLNLEGRRIVLTRRYNNNDYQLLPNSSRYVFPIPGDEIRFSGLEQNER